MSAQPSSAISSPANGSTGQKPRAAQKPATPNDTAQMLPKNSSAARVLSEQFGAISIRCKRLAKLKKSPLRRGGAMVQRLSLHHHIQKPVAQPFHGRDGGKCRCIERYRFEQRGRELAFE
jgi:hypothetical protein